MIFTQKLNKCDLIADRYMIIDEKWGGMGRVFFCEDLKADHKIIYALKTLRDEYIYDANVRFRFENEASAWLGLGNIRDNYVLSLLEILKSGGLPFLKMNYCSNGSLADLLSFHTIHYKECIRISTQLLIGMELLDDQYHLVHRDLKPENVLFDERNDVKISDLGIVKTTNENQFKGKVNVQHTALTQFGAFVGSIPYASPEQLLSPDSVDKRSDIWAFGLILYTMLTCKNPFEAKSEEVFIHNILRSKPQHINILLKLTHKKVGNIIMKCLEKKREKRFESFQEIISEWDGIIKIKNSPKHRSIFLKDKRVKLDIPAIDLMWGQFFPNRNKGATSITSIAVLRSIPEACNYRAIGNYEAALSSYDKVLGNSKNKECYLTDFIDHYAQKFLANRILSCDFGAIIYGKKNLKMTYTPPPLLVRDALIGKMTVLVDIIQERNDTDKYKALIKSYALRILDAGIPDNDLRFLSAQGLYLNSEYNQAFKILAELVEKYPAKAEYEYVMMLCLSKMKDTEHILKFCNSTIMKYSNQSDLPGFYSCAHAYLLKKDYKNCILFAEKAIKLKPNDISVLQKMCVAYLHMANIDEAIQTYHQMLKIDPQSNYTINCGQAISIVTELHKNANDENPEAQFYLFIMHMEGDKVPQDDQIALAWLKKAAANNHEEALKLLEEYDSEAP